MISKRNNKYIVKVYDPAKKSKQRWVGTFEKKSDALRAEANATLETLGCSSETAEGFAEVWIIEIERSKRAPSTKALYSRAARRFAGEFGDQLLDRLDQDRVYEYAIAATTAEINALRVMFNSAGQRGKVGANPFANLRLEQSRGRADIIALSVEQLFALAGGAVVIHGPEYGKEFRALILLTACTGLRAGEVCALKWADLEMRSAEIVVRRSIDCFGNYRQPKNGEERLIGVPNDAIKALGDVPRDREFMFANLSGGPLKKSALFYLWNPVRKAFAPRPDTAFHDCGTSGRPTCAQRRDSSSRRPGCTSATRTATASSSGRCTCTSNRKRSPSA